MNRLKLWQWIILISPLALIIGFLLISAGLQIHEWGINWIWAVFTLLLVGWRWLLVKWTRPLFKEVEEVLAEVHKKLEGDSLYFSTLSPQDDQVSQTEEILEKILEISVNDRPLWEDWETFWQRGQNLVIGIANIYHPEVKYPLFNIYVPQAYRLVRETLNEVDEWMIKLSPIFNQVTVNQAYQAYEVYVKLQPSARKLWQAWNWAQWVLNPVTAFAKKATQKSTDQATQQLLINLSQLIREVALKNLAKQAIILYSGNTLPSSIFTRTQEQFPQVKTQTLREILSQVESPEKVVEKPVNLLLVGRTGAGKSSLINSLFQKELAQVDVLPSTDRIERYHWETEEGAILNIWDTPGYEQINHPELQGIVIEQAKNSDLLLLVTPVLDPALQMDVDFLKTVKENIENLPIITVVNQVDRVRPIREWNPPYDWEWGETPKEISIREATEYRTKFLGEFSDLIIPIVTHNPEKNRQGWGIDTLSIMLVEMISSAKNLRLARFLQNLEARTLAAAKIIDHYTLQITATQGLTSLLKSPLLKFMTTLLTGSPNLAYLLAEKIPVENLPVVLGKLQMTYELFSLFKNDNLIQLDLVAISPLLLVNEGTNEQNTYAFGHALVEYWTKKLTAEELTQRFHYYLNAGSLTPS